MNRRTALRSLLIVPGAAALPSLAEAQEPVVLPAAPAQAAPSETPHTPTVNADSFAEGDVKTFSAEQFSALHRLGELIVPSSPDSPGANEANAAAFLDFLIGQSSSARRELYRAGLDLLNAEARHLYKKPFNEISATEAAPLLQPLREAWTYREPSAALPRFLLAAKEDLIRSTITSREYIAVVSKRRRGAGGSGQYWLPVD